MKYERQPALESHSAFVVSMKGTTLQINKAVVSRQYLNDLISQKVPSDALTLLRSETYDLLEQDGRRECLRSLFGLIRDIRAQFPVYQLNETEP